MKKVPVKIQKGEDGEFWVSSPDVVGFFAIGETREEAIENAKEGISIYLKCETEEIELRILEGNNSD
jgi:predicted RNase H-like HicB family nuclease